MVCVAVVLVPVALVVLVEVVEVLVQGCPMKSMIIFKKKPLEGNSDQSMSTTVTTTRVPNDR